MRNNTLYSLQCKIGDIRATINKIFLFLSVSKWSLSSITVILNNSLDCSYCRHADSGELLCFACYIEAVIHSSPNILKQKSI